MAQLFPMPQLGSTMEEGTILKWLRNEGDTIKKGETLLEIETDKATMEVESPIDAVVRKLLFAADSVVAVQKPIAILGTADESIDALLSAQGGAAPAAFTVPVSGQAATVSIPKETASTHSESMASAGSNEQVFLSPRARKLAEERGISAALLGGLGSGPGGRVVERDVIAYIDYETANSSQDAAAKSRRATPLAAKMAGDLGINLNELELGLPGSRVRRDDILRHHETAPPSGSLLASTPAKAEVSATLAYTSRPFAGMRKRIADNVSKSRFTAPHVTLVLAVDMTECSALRTRVITDIEKAYGVRISFTDILVKATARALQDHPEMNSALVGDQLRVYNSQNIGVAVALEEGLIVPVVQGAGSKSLGLLSQELKPLINRARTGKFTPDDVAGGTFTITNLGSFGIDVFDPIIVPPQAGILGVCRIADVPVVIDKQILIRSMMNLCLSFDHRIVDGAPAAKFLQRIKELLENPITILI